MTETLFDTSVLDEAKIRRRIDNEQLRQQVLQTTLDFLDGFGSCQGPEYVIIFGSVIVPGRFHIQSDVDIAVEAVEPTLFFDLMSSLSIALGREVDLVDLSYCHFADQIRQKGMVWTKTC